MPIETTKRSAWTNQLILYSRVITIGAGLLAVIGSTAMADVSSEQTDGISIEDAVVMPADKGTAARLSFRISNFSTTDLTLIGVTTNASKAAVILLDVPGKGQRLIESLAIRQEETVDLDTSHITVQLLGVKFGIQSGDDIPFKLIFRNQKATGIAHAH